MPDEEDSRFNGSSFLVLRAVTAFVIGWLAAMLLIELVT